jgi:N-methylhydantoinase B
MNSISDISKAFSSISPIDVSIFQSMTHSIAEEMGAALRRTAFSPNIKERRDYSCAIFDGNGQVIAMGDHMPVHLGSMPMSVRAAINAVPLGRGDIAILNDPYCGGTHLPDITMVMAVFADDSDKPIFYTAARAHHADVGGRYPGSMGPCREIYEEGLRIPPVLLVRGGVTDTSLLRTLLENVRTPHEREGDLRAQIGACRIGERRLHELMHKFALPLLNSLAKELFDYSERLTRAEIARMPSGVFEAEDFLDDDGSSDKPIRIHVRLSIDAAQGTTTVDFTGTDPQVENSLNAVLSIAYSAVYYVFRCLLPAGAPATAGLMRPVTLIAPEGSVVNARLPAPVAGGNVETSQRIVDVLLHALASVLPERIPAASCGTMTNLTIGGMDPRHHSPFAYYETTAGGTGALPNRDGISGLHMHMTNSLNTPVEALEYAYPFRVVHYGYRHGSGGKGRFRGGDGLIRELQLLTDAQVTLLADRQKIGPYGLQGGENGTPGHISLLHNGQWSSVPGKVSLIASKGDVIRVETPGGGGWGKAQPTT